MRQKNNKNTLCLGLYAASILSIYNKFIYIYTIYIIYKDYIPSGRNAVLDLCLVLFVNCCCYCFHCCCCCCGQLLHTTSNSKLHRHTHTHILTHAQPHTHTELCCRHKYLVSSEMYAMVFACCAQTCRPEVFAALQLVSLSLFKTLYLSHLLAVCV